MHKGDKLRLKISYPTKREATYSAEIHAIYGTDTVMVKYSNGRIGKSCVTLDSNLERKVNGIVYKAQLDIRREQLLP